ncbi:hypothetical protein VN12_00180 [Pirellula sp. SH-Sr6A]|nr:hypothetical protein VN12_00180 [Pirellula sp. SH-Sr6A]
MPGDPSLLESLRMETAGSTVRTDDTATASIEKPALSLFPMSLMEALVAPSSLARYEYVTTSWRSQKGNASLSPGRDERQ